VRAADTTLAKGAAPPLHVLRVYEDEQIPELGAPTTWPAGSGTPCGSGQTT